MFNMKKKLPNYNISVDGETEGVDFISLVKAPAIMVQWVAFEESERKLRFAQDPVKRMLSGPFLIPDLPIYRRTEELGEFTVTFDAATIETIVKKFFRGQNVLNINEEHSDKKAPAYVMESWIVTDPETDKSAKMGFSLAPGTWFGTVYIESQEYWDQMIASGQVLGFSVEGLMGLAMSQIKKEDTMTQKLNTNTFLAEDGTVIVNKQDAAVLAVGDEVMIQAEDGTQTDVPDGEIKMQDGTVIVVEAGFVLEIKPAEADVAPAAPVAAADVAPTDIEKTRSISFSENAPHSCILYASNSPWNSSLEAVVAPLLEAMRAEVATALAELNDRIVALETASATASEGVAAELSAMKKKFSEIAGGKFSTVATDKKVDTGRVRFDAELERVLELKKFRG